jgi:RNA 2',3'-cyclic 3'-phosphodiesterase
MRCFISVNLDQALKGEIHTAVERLRTEKADVKWVPAGNLHITLKFLGETGEETVARLEDLLSPLAARHESFRISLRGLGLFPDRRRPRVVWIDLIDSGGLGEIQKDIEQTVSTLGFEREDRPFSPHLTIGRVKSPRGMTPLLSAIETLKEKDFGNIEVNAVSLMKSDLKPTGAQYATLAEFHLRRRTNDE